MDSATESALLESLQSSNVGGLYDRFSSFLLPFRDFTPLDTHNPTTTAATGCGGRGSRKTGTTAAPKKRANQPQQKGISKKKAIEPVLLRPLAKRFLPFLCQTLKILPSLLRRSPQSSGSEEEEDKERAAELLAVYGIAADCLWCIAPCLDGKPSTVLLHRARLVRYLESWGWYSRAEEEALSLLASLRSSLFPAQKGKSAGSECFLPDPDLVDPDPDVAALAAEVLIGLTGSTFKSEKRDAAAYERILAVLDQVLPWLRLLDPEASRKQHSQLVNALYKCALFLAGECMSFDGDLVRNFCLRMLRECLESSYIDRFPSIAQKICSSVAVQCESRPLLILDMLRITLDSIVCACEVDMVKLVNEYLEFVSYCADSFRAVSTDSCRGASRLLYERSNDIIQVSPAIASILILYATGLFLKSSDVQVRQSDYASQNSEDSSVILLLLDYGGKLQILTDSLSNLARYFPIASHRNQAFLDHEVKDSMVVSTVDREPKKYVACKHLHGNASLASYLDALESLCRILVEYINIAWKRLVSKIEVVHSANVNHVQDPLLHFCDLILAAFRCTKTSERYRERLHESRKTLLQVAVSVLKFSLGTGGNYQKSLSALDRVISSEWIEPQELKFLISALNNIGASLYDIGKLKQASVALELCCKGIWTHVKLLLQMYSDKSKGIHDDDISVDAIKDVITDASTRSAMILDVLHKCNAANIHDIAVKSLSDLSAGQDFLQNFTGSLALMKQWVKIMCKDFESVDAVDNAPVLYLLLLSYCSTWSKKTVGNILEQELLAYEIMEARNPILCQKMRLKVIDILLKDVYITRDFNLEKSRVLVRKGRALRDSGMEGLSSCIKCLSEAISLLSNICDDPSRANASIYHQLALTYCLHAQCVQEASHDCEVILHDVQCAVNLWSSIDVQNYCSTDAHLELVAERTIPLLCNIVDLLSLKGCSRFQFDIYKLIIIFCKRGNIPLEKCLAMLWTGRRLNHSLCTSPIDGDFISKASQDLDIHANSIEYWMSCIKEPSSQLMFLQKFLLCDSLLPEVSRHSSGRSFGSKVTIDEVKQVASSLVADVPLASKQAFIAGYIYYDLSERLFSVGRVFEALSYAKEALRLRRKILWRKFSYSFEQKSAKLVDSGKVAKKSCDHVCLEAVGSVITEVWPDVSKSINLEDSIFSPWSVLRCYLDSILQVGILHESTGNGAEAESLFQTGKRISNLQVLPIYEISFTSLLGQLYRKKQLWDLAANELNNAKKLLVENDMIISCKHCKLAFEVTIGMQFGDLSRNLFEKGLQVESARGLSHALGLYRSVLEKLNHAKSEGSLSICEKSETMSTLLSKHHEREGKHGVLDSEKLSLAMKVRSPICRICAAISHDSNVHHDRQMQSVDGKQPSLKTEGGGSLVNLEVKKRCRSSSKYALKEHILDTELKPRRTRASNRSCANRGANVAGGVDKISDKSASNGFCSDTMSLKKSQMKVNGSSPYDLGCSEECICDRTKCWRCLLIKVTEAGSVKNIISLKWECQRRRLLVKLLVKIARCLGAHGGNHGAHEVHDAFWQCISVLYNRKPFSQSYSGVPDSRLIEFIGEENSGDIFSIECATLLYSISWFSLKNCSEYSRISCCNLSNIQMSTVVPWLLRAFILCRELPLLFHKVSELLASIFILSTLSDPISLPLCSDESLSPSHWAAYFHQASLGTYLHCEYLSCARDKSCNSKASEGVFRANMADTIIKESNIFRFAPEKLEQLEEFVRDFFQSLPSIPIVCVSMLGGDYVNLLGETLCLPSFFPAWMLLTRLDAINQPIAMLLPVDFIVEEIENDNSEKDVLANKGSINDWQCPWGDTIIDYVAPSFKMLLEENFSSLSNMTPIQADAHVNCVRWWSQRTRINDRLNKLLKSMEDSWLGPWGCLFLGAHSNPEYLDTIVSKLIDDLKFHCNFEMDRNLLKAILSGANSVADAEACISQSLVYKGYFGRGSCCGKERFRAFSSTCHRTNESVSESTHDLILEAIGESAEKTDREPIILVLDTDVQMLPWENLPILRNQEVYRMPSVASISITLNRSLLYQKQDKAIGVVFPSIDPFDAYYLLNPSGDLNNTQVEFEQWFRNQKWEGKAGIVPTTKELVLALQNHDLFLYFGHGSGTQYISPHEIQKLDHCAATLLMGCSSGSFLQKGCYAPQGAPLFYLYAGSPAVIANLWDVTDKDIDRFGKAMLNSWLQEESVSFEDRTRCNQLVKEFECVSIDEGNATTLGNRKKAHRGKEVRQLFDKGNLEGCGRRKRIASFMSQAREACKLPLLIGAAPVCYGVPTIIRQKSK